MYIEKVKRVFSFINDAGEMNLTIECIMNGELHEINFPRINLANLDVIVKNNGFWDNSPSMGQLILNLNQNKKNSIAEIRRIGGK